MEHGVLSLAKPSPRLSHAVVLLSRRVGILVPENHKHSRYKVQGVAIILNLHYFFLDFGHASEQENVGHFLGSVVDYPNPFGGGGFHHVVVTVTVVKGPPQEADRPRAMNLDVGRRAHGPAPNQRLEVLGIFDFPAGAAISPVFGVVNRSPGIRFYQHKFHRAVNAVHQTPWPVCLFSLFKCFIMFCCESIKGRFIYTPHLKVFLELRHSGVSLGRGFWQTRIGARPFWSMIHALINDGMELRMQVYQCTAEKFSL